jgi:hypothetical protein
LHDLNQAWLVPFSKLYQSALTSIQDICHCYKVKVSYMASSEIEIKIREESLAKVIFGG